MSALAALWVSDWRANVVHIEAAEASWTAGDFDGVADEQKELMREMQAQMARLMEKGLDASATVAGGLAGAVRGGVERSPVVIDNRSGGPPGAAPAARQGTCDNCGEAVDPDWKVCPFCEARLARA